MAKSETQFTKGNGNFPLGPGEAVTGRGRGRRAQLRRSQAALDELPLLVTKTRDIPSITGQEGACSGGTRSNTPERYKLPGR